MSTTKTAELCWGQRYHWLRYQQLPTGARHDAHIVAAVPLPDGVSVADLRSTLDYLIRRHEALRTVFEVLAAPWPQQVVQPPARLPLREVSVEADGTPGPAEVIAELTVADFDLTRDWPIRACVVTSGGSAKRLVVVLNHVAFDDSSLAAFRQEFELVLTAITSRRRANLAPVAHQPADLARAEAAHPADAALAYWQAEAARVPADLFAGRRTVGEPITALSASLTSPGLLGAARELAGRHRVWPSAVQLAAYVVLMSAYSGQPVVGFRWLTSHRQGAEHDSVLSCMFAPTLVTVDLSDNPAFGEVIRRTAEQVTAAQDHAYLAYDLVVELTAAEAFRRGQALRVESDLNFLSYPTRSCGVRRDRFTPNPTPSTWAQAGSDVYLRIQEWSDGVTVGLHALSTIIAAPAAERFLRGWVELVTAHAEDATMDLTVHDIATRFGGFEEPLRPVVRLGSDAVDLAGTAALLTEHPAVSAVTVTVAGAQLVARVHAGGPVTAAELRGFVSARLYERAAVRCPDRFEIEHGADVSVSDGREGAGTAESEAELVLAKVVAEVNGLDEVRLTDCYVSAGGRVLRVPRVLAGLADLGWRGVSQADLCTAIPLAALAARLH